MRFWGLFLIVSSDKKGSGSPAALGALKSRNWLFPTVPVQDAGAHGNHVPSELQVAFDRGVDAFLGAKEADAYSNEFRWIERTQCATLRPQRSRFQSNTASKWRSRASRSSRSSSGRLAEALEQYHSAGRITDGDMRLYSDHFLALGRFRKRSHHPVTDHKRVDAAEPGQQTA